jgi:hypothetical protein
MSKCYIYPLTKIILLFQWEPREDSEYTTPTHTKTITKEVKRLFNKISDGRRNRNRGNALQK